MLKLVFCDPSERNRTQLDNILADYAKAGTVSVRGFSRVAAFMTYMDRYGDSTDVAIANIELDGVSGIRLMGTIQERLPDLQIVFVSRYPEMIYDTYAVRHIAFLPYPLNAGHMRMVLDGAARYARVSKKRYMTFSSRGLISKIDYDSIMYLESNLRNINVHELNRIRTFSGRLEDAKLMLDSRFVQCHKSFMVNLSCAVELNADSIMLYNGESVPVSARKLRETREAFYNYVNDSYYDTDDLLSATDTIIN